MACGQHSPGSRYAPPGHLAALRAEQKLDLQIVFASVGGAHDRNRTGDLVLTKDVLYRLSYVGLDTFPTPGHGAGDGNRTHAISLEG